jgi:putative permease
MSPRPGDMQMVTRTLLLGAGAVVALWFLYVVRTALLFGLLAVILAMVLNRPVTWLERRGLRRGLATLISFVTVLAVTAGILWLVVPRLVAEIPLLIEAVPALAQSLADNLGEHPFIQEQLTQVVDWILGGIGQLWRTADSLLGGALLAIVLVALVLYLVVNPAPLVRRYIRMMPPDLREPAARALARSSDMAVGWMLANVIVGVIKAPAAYLFLVWMQVPGAIVWAVLAFFAQLIPRIGFYLMAIPPTVVALTVSPMTAVWVGLFYWLISEILGNFVAPKVQEETMDMHPFVLLFATVVMAVAFGVIGVLVSVPLVGMMKAYFDEFYLKRQPDDPHLEDRVDLVLRGETDVL